MEKSIQVPTDQPDRQKYGISRLRRTEQKEWLQEIISQAQERSFYGTITVTFKEGNMSLVEQTETFKPPT